jgi:hypothetical protein
MKGLRIYGTLALLTLTGCAGQSWKVASLMNKYDWYENRYEETCVNVQPTAGSVVECRATRVKLDEFRKHLLESSKALVNGGNIHLQLSQTQKDAKVMK